MKTATISRLARKYLSIELLVLISILYLFSVSCAEKKVSTLQRDYLTPDIMCGTVQFSDGCSPKLDTLISFGIALIHHMTYEDAEHTFSKVIEMDKDCFWGYWGKAMTYVHPLWPDVPDKNMLNDGFILSQNALKLAKTEKEKLYGAAIATFFEDGVNKTEPERLIAFNDGWQFASQKLPEDIEARMFSVLSMLAVASPYDKTYKVQREAGAICEKVLETFPDHPGATHYAIHAYDVPPLAPQALRVARNYYKIAPEIPHALHMPTHIFTRLGYWQESIDLNLRSAEVAKKIPVNGQISGQYFHALDYALYAYLQQSEYKEAKDIAVLLDSLSGTFEPSPVTAYSLAAIPGRMALELQNWWEAANLSLNTHSKFPWNKFPQYEALIYFAKGIGAGRSGNLDVAQQSFQKLEELQNTFEITEANKYWIDQIEIQKTVVKSWLLFAQNEKEKSLETMILAAKLEDATEKNPVTPGTLLPAREMLGDLLLEMNRPKDALEQYELSLKNTPNRLNALYGAGKSAELLGDLEKAKFYFTAVLKNNKSSETNSERLAHALSMINNKM
jgi:tetratricopeptide (TPR) repeat protein